jgi:hypothetical protein
VKQERRIGEQHRMKGEQRQFFKMLSHPLLHYIKRPTGARGFARWSGRRVI